MIDHLRNTQSVGLEDLAVLILDEADRLLEMGFAEEVRCCAACMLHCMLRSGNGAHGCLHCTTAEGVQWRPRSARCSNAGGVPCNPHTPSPGPLRLAQPLLQINEVVKMAPVRRQTMLFSATMTEEVKKLVALSLKHPVRWGPLSGSVWCPAGMLPLNYLARCQLIISLAGKQQAGALPWQHNFTCCRSCSHFLQAGSGCGGSSP